MLPEVRSHVRPFQCFEEYSVAARRAGCHPRQLSKPSPAASRRCVFHDIGQIRFTGCDCPGPRPRRYRDIHDRAGQQCRRRRTGLRGANRGAARSQGPFAVDRARSASSLEQYVLAASVEGSEVFLDNVACGIAANCAVAVLYTGYYGGVIWNRHTGVSARRHCARGCFGTESVRGSVGRGICRPGRPFIYGRNIGDIAPATRGKCGPGPRARTTIVLCRAVLLKAQVCT